MSKIKIEPLYEGQALKLILNDPKANVLDSSMMQALQTALDDLKHQNHVKLILFTGAGEHFSFGASVTEHQRQQVAEMLQSFHRLFFTLAELAIPTAAMVSGQCLGGGFELVMMCNFLFLDRSARLGQPEINLGVFAPPASLILPMKIGQTKADELLLSGRTIDADTADSLGLATQVFADRAAMEKGVEEWTQKRLLAKSASSLKFAVRAARWQFNANLNRNLQELERMYVEELMATHDASEGIQAFLEKRKPNWQDR